MTYAKTAQRLTERKKEIARFEAEMFSIEIGYLFTGLSRDDGEYSADYVNPFVDETDNWAAAEVVICPNCQQIQVCYGQYGDPETETCICSQCHNAYQMEPF